TAQFDEATNMRMKSIVLFLTALGGCIVASPAVLADEYHGTMEQQMACTPDVWRLCSDQIPDTDRIVACLRRNTPRLSEDCRAVFASRDSSNQPPSRGRRPPPPVAGQPVQPAPRSDDWFRQE